MFLHVFVERSWNIKLICGAKIVCTFGALSASLLIRYLWWYNFMLSYAFLMILMPLYTFYRGLSKFYTLILLWKYYVYAYYSLWFYVFFCFSVLVPGNFMKMVRFSRKIFNESINARNAGKFGKTLGNASNPEK